jgi:hypothetical protein
MGRRVLRFSYDLVERQVKTPFPAGRSHQVRPVPSYSGRVSTRDRGPRLFVGPVLQLHFFFAMMSANILEGVLVCRSRL